MEKRDKIRDSINTILDCGGKVTVGYKQEIGDWVGDVSIYYLESRYGMKPKYWVQGGCYHGDYTSRDEAIERFIDTAFTEKNLWMILERIRIRLGIDDWEEDYSFENPSPDFLDMIEKEKELFKIENES